MIIKSYTNREYGSRVRWIFYRRIMKENMKYENVLHVLVNHANSSSKASEKILANRILANFEEIPNVTIEKLADICYVSQPTLTRFIKKLGYPNYNTFKTTVTHLVDLMANEKASDLFEVDENDPIISHSNALESSLRSTSNRIKTSEIKMAAKKIHRAKKIGIIGIDYSQVVAFDAQLRFMRYQKVFETGVTSVEQQNVVNSLGTGDLLIVLSVSGLTNALKDVTEQVAPGVETILITSNHKPTILQDNINLQVIHISEESNQKTNTSQIGRFNLLLIIDMLYITYGQMYHSEVIPKL